jgi:hypothetical protein
MLFSRRCATVHVTQTLPAKTGAVDLLLNGLAEQPLGWYGMWLQ